MSGANDRKKSLRLAPHGSSRETSSRAGIQELAAWTCLYFTQSRHFHSADDGNTFRGGGISKMSFRSLTLLASAAIFMSGCATIMGNPTQTIPISSTPSDAKVLIMDEAGNEIFTGSTPTSVTLNKSTGKYWGGKSFKVNISKPGFKTQVIPVTSSPNGWYIAGNFLFGGLIGWFVVDPLSGNMYTLSPEAVAANVDAETAHNNQVKDGSIAIMLLQDVPVALREKLARIDAQSTPPVQR